MPRVLLLSENFTPSIGGSAVLFEESYGRIDGTHVVWTDADSSPGDSPERRPPFEVHRMRVATPERGLLAPRGWRHHLGLARRLGSQSRFVVHAARPIPEGVAAWLSHRMGGPPYVTWSHGEELSTARQSRDQAITTGWVVRDAVLCIGNSQNTAGQLASYGVPEARIRVVRPGVDCDRFHPGVDGTALRASLAGPDDLLVVSVGRLQRRKGHDQTVRALALLREDGLTHIRLAIGGTGEMEGELRSMAAQLRIADAVTFLGRVAQGDLPALYAAADVFAMPNRDVGNDFEGFGIVFLEAQATARPVIAGRSGGAPEAVVEGRTALLVDGSRPEVIADAIRRLAADPGLRARMGAAGRQHVLEHCRWSVAAQKLRAIHEEAGGR